jgi:hypothetical protein
MIESGTLQCFDLRLTTQGLLHIGDGKVIPKKFYMLNGNTMKNGCLPSFSAEISWSVLKPIALVRTQI